MEINIDKTVKLGCVSGVLSEEIDKRLKGEILTVIDAVVTDLTSRKATKDIISQSISRVSRNVLVKLNNIGGN